MVSDFSWDGGSEMTPKNRTLEGKNWTLGGVGGSKLVGHHLWMFLFLIFCILIYCSFKKKRKNRLPFNESKRVTFPLPVKLLKKIGKLLRPCYHLR